MTFDVVYITPSTATELIQIADDLEQFFITRLGPEKYKSSMYIGMGIRVPNWIEKFKKSLEERIAATSSVNELISDHIKVILTSSQLHDLAELINKRKRMIEASL